MEQVIKLFTQIIKAEVTGGVVGNDVIAQITPEIMDKLYTVSKKHDLAHIVAAVLQKNNLLGEDKLSQRYSQDLYMSVMRYENIQYELERICELFESEQIIHIPLKGSVIRKFYPEPWLRTSCDIDILIHPEDLDRACELLRNRLDYRSEPCSYKDISLYAPSGVHLELHFMIQEDIESLDRVLCRVWEYAYPAAEGGWRYEMTPEFFMFHIFAHMSYHFSGGGCGIRTFVDVWLLMNRMEYDETILQKLCEESNIWQFVLAVRTLARIWFEDEPYDELSTELEAYVVSGGTYGTKETSMTAKKTKTPRRMKYILKRIFVPHRHLIILYPRLEKAPFLYPYYTVVRWCKVLKGDVFKRVTSEAKLHGDIEEKQVDELKRLFDKLGL